MLGVCKYRIIDGIQIYCRHSLVQKPKNLVTEEECSSCEFSNIPDQNPRIIELPTEKKGTYLSAALDVTKALSQFVYSRGDLVTIGQYLQRLNICQSCKDLDEDGYTCSLCKCVLFMKASSPHFTCKVNKWPDLVHIKKQKVIIRAKESFSFVEHQKFLALLTSFSKNHPNFLIDFRGNANYPRWDRNFFLPDDDPETKLLWVDFSNYEDVLDVLKDA